MKKQLPALLAAIIMTGLITLVMFVTSANALLNKNVVDAANSPATAAAVAAVPDSSVSQQEITQLQNRITEYAQREQQYQQREQQLQQQIQNDQNQVQQAGEQLQQIQQLLQALQARGLIRVQGNSIMITGGTN